MLFADLNLPDTYTCLSDHPVWREILQWLRSMPSDIPCGIYSLRDDQSIFVNVHTYETLPREKCRFESHIQHIDLQYMIEGEELIEWRPTPDLTPWGSYQEEKDVQHYELPDRHALEMRLSPGKFAVFYSSDGHMPKKQVRESLPLKKLVVKILRSAFDPPNTRKA